MPADSFTIVAPATPPAAGGVGILRLSGPSALRIALEVAPDVPAEPVARHAYFAKFVAAGDSVLDEGLFIYFRAPHSYTGEDVVELQAHGSPRLMQVLQSQILRDPRVRVAEPGEFTRRAFLNGRMDLARAEAIADLVAAESEAGLRSAARQLRGSLSEKVRALLEPLRALHADLEGLLNFPEEAEGAADNLASPLSAVAKSARELLAEAGRGALIRRGARVVLFGPVNAGKSTLFNRLLGEARALVDEEPGTTRDSLEGRMELSGLLVTLIDTAGLRPTPGRLESLGIERTRQALGSSNLALLVLPPDATPRQADEWMQEAAGSAVLRIFSKSDLQPSTNGGGLRVSGRTGEGLAELEQAIVAKLWGEGIPQAVDLTSERHADAVRRASDCLDRALSALASSTLEVVSGEIGLAAEALGEITGENAPEALLDAIFQRFCIGK
ncbi:MAG TPA: tRNA uridine-5-carboxymethylaminomethyl(34) synthesis GTPase MnmE [Myxococcaceae bacterium]|nr:tRNA uridine-5-carboxymethylaminomethyl(34) synthesis GTPase MnmE [Myxococcaceae bacterium]